VSKKTISRQRVLQLLDDPEFQLAAAEYPDLYEDEIDAMNDFLRSVTPPVPEHVRAAAPTALKIIGTRQRRIEDPARLTGQALYASDVRLPDMLHVAILRSPYAHASIASIDTAAAEKLPGVRAVLTYKNAPKAVISAGPPVKAVVNQEVHFEGEEVAAVAADDMHTAREAVNLIKVQWKVLPTITDLEAVMAAGAPALIAAGTSNFSVGTPVKRGDFDTAYAASAVKLEGAFTTSTLQHGPLEPHVSVARWEGPDRLVIWASSQYMSSVRSSLASFFAMPRSHVRVSTENVGGGFGSKGGPQRDTYIAAVMAQMTQRPVRVAYDRPGNFKAATHRYAEIMRLKAGLNKDGTLKAYSLASIGDGGAYKAGTSALPPIQRVYEVNDASFQETNVITNRGMSGPMRCVGDPQGTFAQEIFVDELAEKAGMNPYDFRMKNMASVDQDHEDRKWNSFGLPEAAQKGAAAIGWSQKWHKPAGKITGTKAHGIGMALHACGHGSMSLPMTAFVRLDRDGSLDVNNSLTEIGGGQATAAMMIAAETVGVKISDAQPSWNDTGFLPDAGVTAGSRGTISAGSAMRNAALDLKYQIMQVATAGAKPMLAGKPEDVDTGDGFAFLKADPSKKVSLADVANSTGNPMLGRGTHVVPPNTSMSTFAAGFAEVEVDLDTGDVSLLRYVAAADVGKSINQLGVEQQIEGAVSMGIGLALLEEQKYDPQNNYPVNWSWENYAMPTTLDHPKWADFTPIIVEPIDAIGPYGAKGVGEPPASPPGPAIANAIYNAIGVRIHDAPLTRDKVLAAIAQMKR
jgi:CO/xanthine dehydrogenase Mo-binding subunit